jgi:Cu+-exporting ATPase
MQLRFEVQGMRCMSCVGRLQKALAALPHLSDIQVELLTSSVSATLLPEVEGFSAALLQQQISDAGYQLVPGSAHYQVGGLSCSSCARRVQQALLQLPQVLTAEVSVLSGQLQLQLLSPLSQTEVAAALKASGYWLVQAVPEPAAVSEAVLAVVDNPPAAAMPAPTSKPDTPPTSSPTAIPYWQQTWFAVLLSNLLTLPLVLPMLAMLWGQHWMLAPHWQFLLATPVQFYFGRDFYRAGWAALKARSGNMDLLVALGTSAAYLLSLYLWWRHSGDGMAAELYFESSAAVISLVLLGKYLEHKAKKRTLAALEQLASLQPAQARVWQASRGQWQLQSASAVQSGDRLQVWPGERLPVDGVVLLGRALVDEALISGESLPQPKTVDSIVTGGSVALDGVLEIRATTVGAESILAKIIRLVQQAQSAKAPVQALVDRISAVFVPVVLVLSLLTLLGWGLATADWQQAILNAVAVLVIACPCALGLATPAAVMAGTGSAARSGILLKKAAVLQQAQQIDTVVFDKTGTLTQGKPLLATVLALDCSEQQALQWAASLQQQNDHPLAGAVLAAAQQQQLPLLPLTAMQLQAGLGLQGEVAGRQLLLGSSQWLESLAVRLPEFAEKPSGASLSWLAQLSAASDSSPAAVSLLAGFAFTDQVKAEAVGAVQALQQQGLSVMMLTGDNQASAALVANLLGITQWQAALLPADKAQAIARLQQQGQRVAMVGDGINDAPALAQADLGLAMATGTAVAVSAADITLLHGNPALVPAALQICQRTYRKIQQNLGWAFLFNGLGLPLAALGYLNPVLAGAAMAASSVLVMTNALLLQRWRARLPLADQPVAGQTK